MLQTGRKEQAIELLERKSRKLVQFYPEFSPSVREDAMRHSPDQPKDLLMQTEYVLVFGGVVNSLFYSGPGSKRVP